MNLLELKSLNIIRMQMYGDKPTDTQKIIAMRSSPHVHTELRFSERYDRISFSAEKGLGVRFKQIKYSHPYRWDTVKIWMTDSQEDACWQQAKEIEGKEYDFVGTLSFATKLDIIKPHKDKYWCTGACMVAVIKGRKDFEEYLLSLKQPPKLSPEDADVLARYYFSVVEKFYDEDDAKKVINELILADKQQ